MKIFLDTYLKTRKSHFSCVYYMVILTKLWAQNSRTGVKNCAEHEFSTENQIAPLFGVVRDLENRQKSAIFKIGSKRLIQSFWADGVICKCPNGCRIVPKHVIISF